MIKKKLKKWYPTKQQEDNALILQRILDASTHIHRTTTHSYGNWVIVGSDVATQLSGITNGNNNYFTNTTAVNNLVSETANALRNYWSTGSTVTISSGMTSITTSVYY